MTPCAPGTRRVLSPSPVGNMPRKRTRKAKSATVLVIDDSPTVLRVIEGVLLEAGYEACCLESARDVIDVARRVEPDMMFIDFAMPEINGYAVCRALGEHPDLESIPIVLMNTRGDSIGERFVREMGIIDHITKPFAPEALLAVVENTLRKARTTDPSLWRRVSSDTLDSEPTAPPTDRRGIARRRLASLLARRVDDSDGDEDLATKLEHAFSEPDVLEAARQALHLHDTIPALAGSLADVPIAEVMQLLALQRQTGFLRIRRGSSEICIAIEKGTLRLVTGAKLPPEFLLDNILVQEKLIDEDELAVFLRNHHGSRRRVGMQLARLGYLTRDQLHHALRRQSTELVYELLRWSVGEFTFELADALPPEVQELEFDIGIDEVLMEGYRRVDEWGLIENALPSFDLVPQVVPGGLERLGPQGLTTKEQIVHAAIDGRRTMNQIIQRIGFGTFEGARLLYRLVSAHVIRTGET